MVNHEIKEKWDWKEIPLLVKMVNHKIKEKWGWKEIPLEPRGYYQLHGRYRFWNEKTGEVTTVNGYSRATRTKRRGRELGILRSQVIDYAIAQLDGWRWVLDDIEYEVWLKW